MIQQTCGSCGSKLYIISTNPNSIPVSGYVVDTKETALFEPSYELTLLKCSNCGLIQLKQSPNQLQKLRDVYNIYQSTYSMSEFVKQYMYSLYRELSRKYLLHTGDTMLEIGCNDGSSLSIARDNFGFSVVGVEPSKLLSRSCTQKGIPVINNYFSNHVAEEIVRDFGFARVIIIRHVLEHTINPREFIRDVKRCMNNETIVVIEVPSIDMVISEFHWEGIAHPHLYYFSESSLSYLLNSLGMVVTLKRKTYTDGGSILVVASFDKEQTTLPDEIEMFEKRREKHIIDIIEKLYTITAIEKKTIYGFGAGKGSTILNMIGADDALVKYVVDDDIEKQEKYIPGCGIKVVSDEYLTCDKEPDYLIMLAPTHTGEIKTKLSNRFPKRKFKFIDIIPSVEIEK